MAQCWNARKAVADAENMLFRVGQHVELFEHPWHSLGKNPGPVPPDMHLQLGDRFTVCGYSDTHMHKLMYHKDGTMAHISGKYLKEVTYNSEPAGCPRAHYDTLRALGVVLQNDVMHTAALDEVRLDLERARMEREDFRQHNGPACSLRVCALTTRQLTQQLNDVIDEQTEALATIAVCARNNQNRPTIRKADADTIRVITEDFI